MRRDELARYLDELLAAPRFKDYSPNGLQVEGRAEIRRLVAGVTASRALVEVAVERDADGILVHHGWFWRGEDGRVTGFRRERMKPLLARDINLFAYHLPLDAHAEFGNNARWAARLGWQVEGRFGDQDVAFFGTTPLPTTAGALAAAVGAALGREPMLIGDPDRPVARIAWCSGAAQGYFESAAALGVDAYLSGEISEQTVHLANETGVAYLACGHHATERFGVEALAGHLAERFGIDVEFVDIDNPV